MKKPAKETLTEFYQSALPGTLEKRAVGLFQFLTFFVDGLLFDTGNVESAEFLYPDGNRGSALDYDEIKHQIRFATFIEYLLLIETDKNVYRVPIKIKFDKFMLAEKYPEKPPFPETDLYNYITTYSIPCIEDATGNGVVVFDGLDHHPEVPTNPHHMHPIRNNRNRKAQPFTGMIADLVSALDRYIK